MYQSLMVQGVRAGIGKSLIVIGVCRHLSQHGLRVGVFKAQAMEDRSVRLADGGLVPANLVLAARGCEMPLSRGMCPLLLTPADAIGDAIDNLALNLRYRVAVLGEPVGVMTLDEYYGHRDDYWAVVLEHLAAMQREYDVVVIEGSGNPAELNTMHIDFCNMRVAEAADAGVLMVADLALGGAFAALAGVAALLPTNDRARIVGMIMNKAVAECDIAFLRPGAVALERHIGHPVIGIVPIIADRVFTYPKMEMMDLDSVPWETALDKFTQHLVAHLDMAPLRLAWPALAERGAFL